MKKYGTYSLIAFALALVLSACMSPAERDFRAMSAVQQMEGVQNLSWTKKSHGSAAVSTLITFGEEPLALYSSEKLKNSKEKHGVYSNKVLTAYPFFNVAAPVIYLPGLEQWEIEKSEEKENTFTLTNADKACTYKVSFDPNGRLADYQLVNPRGILYTVKVIDHIEQNGKYFPAKCEVETVAGKKVWQYSNWKFDQAETEVQKLIEDNKKLSNNQNVKERSNP